MQGLNKELLPHEKESLLNTLETRFYKNRSRHNGLEWNQIKEKLDADPTKLWSLNEMNKTGGEPDIVDFDKKTDTYIYFDCSAESPAGRRSLCYDSEGLDSRKEFKPKNNVIDLANEMGIEILTEEQYRFLQQLGKFDTKTSSWLKTPTHIRKLGGAIFGDFRFDNVFIYHNGAQSYYGGRGFRGCLRV